MTSLAAETSPQVYARSAGALYVVTIVTGLCAVLFATGRTAANVAAGVSYIAVTLLFYVIFKPVDGRLSLAAAIVSLAGCAFGILAAIGRAPFGINPLVFFGVYCLMIGYLVFTSTFLPRALGVLMVIGGLGWLTFLLPNAAALMPFNMLPGVVGESALTLWLLVIGVNVERWKLRARASR